MKVRSIDYQLPAYVAPLHQVIAFFNVFSPLCV
jgi:hypothetical protein